MTSPSFLEAERRFRAFLHNEGWPDVIVWVRSSEVVWEPGPRCIIETRLDADGVRDAETTYELARRKGLGVALEGVCTLGEATCAVVTCPSDELDAELLMYPPDGGLKLSVPVRRTEGIRRSSRFR